MADDRCLISYRMIQSELERAAGLSNGSTSLHVIKDSERLLWQVGNRFVRVGPIPDADRRLCLNEFAALHCEPAVRIMQEGGNV